MRPEVGSKLGITIRNDFLRHTKRTNPMLKENSCTINCRNITFNRDKHTITRKPINDAKNGIMPILSKW
jgi:hypothetical protein